MIIFDKKKYIIVITHQNIESTFKIIENALNSKLLVKLDDDRLKNQYFMIIQSISFRLILNSRIDGFFPLSVSELLLPPKVRNDYLSYTEIQNINICLKLIWQNQLMLKCWMKDRQKWFVLFSFLTNIFEIFKDSFIVPNPLSDLISTLMSTGPYWTKKHFIFLNENEVARSCMKFIKHTYLVSMRKKPSSALSDQLLNITKIFYMYHIQYDNQLKFRLWMKQIKDVSKGPCCDGCKERNPNAIPYFDKEMDNFMSNLRDFKKKYNKQNLTIGRITTSHKRQIISKKYDIFSDLKLCGNIDCKNKNKYDKLKVCKGCRVIYYCNKYCQKVDWKNIHKKQCAQLFHNMKYAWKFEFFDH